MRSVRTSPISGTIGSPRMISSSTRNCQELSRTDAAGPLNGVQDELVTAANMRPGNNHCVREYKHQSGPETGNWEEESDAGGKRRDERY